MITFTSMYGYVETAISSAVASFGSGLVSFVAAPLGVAATIYFLLLGFAVLRGAIQAPLRELIFQAGKVGFALAAASAVGYSTFVVNVATNLPSEIISAGSGAPVTNPGTTFDTYVSDTNKLAKIISDDNDKVQSQTASMADFELIGEKTFANLVAFLAIVVLYIFAALSAAVGFCIVVFAKLAVSICVALAPLALACLLFNSSRWLFDGWLKQTANYILLMVVISIMTQFITGLEAAVMDDIMGAVGDGSMFMGTSGGRMVLDASGVAMGVLSCVIIYIVGTVFFFQSPSIAAGIAGGASSGGHGFLQTGANIMANRLLFRRLAQSNNRTSSPPTGGTVTRRGS
ncbi:type IV secretion system protein [Novosphingobium sp. KN65.2]|uniref:type IV secretion system protein n=1 Tax=Novosphingobium sp. KN65.2 TaxID=1478134 RepID=UPI0006D55C07